MINFRKEIVRVKKFSIEEGEFYLKDLSSAQVKLISEDIEDPEEVMFYFVDSMLCDEKGKLQNLSKEELEALPRTVLEDIVKSIQEMALGKKKANG